MLLQGCHNLVARLPQPRCKVATTLYKVGTFLYGHMTLLFEAVPPLQVLCMLRYILTWKSSCPRTPGGLVGGHMWALTRSTPPYQGDGGSRKDVVDRRTCGESCEPMK